MRLPMNKISLLRLVFYTSVFICELRRPPDLFSRWFSIFSHVNYPHIPAFMLSPAAFLFIKYSFLSLCLVCALSLLSRATSFLCFLFGTAYFVLMYSIGFADHHVHLVWHVLLVFTVFENFSHFNENEFVFIVRLLFVCAFLSAGLAKLQNVGLDWFKVETHIHNLLRQRLLFSGHGYIYSANDLNYFFIKHINWLKYAFYIALPLELLAPLALHKKGRALIILLGFMQVLSAFAFYAFFVEWIGIYIFWIVRSEIKLDLFGRYGAGKKKKIVFS